MTTDGGRLLTSMNLVPITVDYETDSRRKKIDWEVVVFVPAEKQMNPFERFGASITFLAEMGEYLWLECNAQVVTQADKWDGKAADRIVEIILHAN